MVLRWSRTSLLKAPLAAPAPGPERPVDVPRLPDVLRDNLDVVFVGTAAGCRSAELGVYYAHSGNYFWRTLWQIGLTPRRFPPHDFAKLRDVGIGFTDLSKSGCGMDHETAAETFDLTAFEAKMRQHQPRAIAFTSRKAASLWLHRRTDRIAYGRQKTPVRGSVRGVRASLAVAGGAALLEDRSLARSRRLAARDAAVAFLS